MANEEIRFSDNIKKVLLAGLGVLSLGADKSKDLAGKSQEILESLVKRGELTADQARSLGKDLSEQGKSFRDELVEKVTSASTRTRDKAAEALKGRKVTVRGKEIDLSEVIGGLNKEQFEALKESIGLKKKEEE